MSRERRRRRVEDEADAADRRLAPATFARVFAMMPQMGKAVRASRSSGEIGVASHPPWRRFYARWWRDFRDARTSRVDWRTEFEPGPHRCLRPVLGPAGPLRGSA